MAATETLLVVENEAAIKTLVQIALERHGYVVLAAEYTDVPSAFGPKLNMNLPLPLLREPALAYGPVNLISDPDGVVRSALLGLLFQDRIFPAFAYQTYRAIDPQAHDAPASWNQLQDAVTYINYRGPPRTYPEVPYYRVLRDEIEAAFFRVPSIVALRNPLPDTLIPKETGLCVPPGDPGALADARRTDRVRASLTRGAR